MFGRIRPGRALTPGPMPARTDWSVGCIVGEAGAEARRSSAGLRDQQGKPDVDSADDDCLRLRALAFYRLRMRRMPSRGTHLACTKRPVRAPAVPRTRSRGRSLPSSRRLAQRLRQDDEERVAGDQDAPGLAENDMAGPSSHLTPARQPDKNEAPMPVGLAIRERARSPSAGKAAPRSALFLLHRRQRRRRICAA